MGRTNIREPKRHTPKPSPLTHTQAQIDAERKVADDLAEILRALTKGVSDYDSMHVIAVLGTQITYGAIVAGILARYDQVRLDREF